MDISRNVRCVLLCVVGGCESFDMYLALATGHGNVDETASVKNTLVGATLGVLLLLLGLDLDAKLSLKDRSGRWPLRIVYRVALAGNRRELTLGVAALTLPARAREP